MQVKMDLGKKLTLAELAKLVKKAMYEFELQARIKVKDINDMASFLNVSKDLISDESMDIIAYSSQLSNGEETVFGACPCCGNRFEERVEYPTRDMVGKQTLNAAKKHKGLRVKCPKCGKKLSAYGFQRGFGDNTSNGTLSIFSKEGKKYKQGIFVEKLNDTVVMFWGFEPLIKLEQSINVDSIADVKEELFKSPNITVGIGIDRPLLAGFWSQATGIRFIKEELGDVKTLTVNSGDHMNSIASLDLALRDRDTSPYGMEAELRYLFEEESTIIAGNIDFLFNVTGVQSTELAFKKMLIPVKRAKKAVKKENPSERFIGSTIKYPKEGDIVVSAFVMNEFDNAMEVKLKCPYCGKVHEIEKTSERMRYGGREKHSLDCDCGKSVQYEISSSYSSRKAFLTSDSTTSTISVKHCYFSLLEDPIYNTDPDRYEKWQQLPCLCIDIFDTISESTIYKDRSIENNSEIKFICRFIYANDKIHVFDASQKDDNVGKITQIGAHNCKIGNLNDYRSITDNVFGYYGSNAISYQSKEEVLNIIENSCLGKKGLGKVAENMIEEKDGSLYLGRFIKNDSFLYQIYKYPILEQLAKSGFEKLVIGDKYNSSYNNIVLEADNVMDAIGVSNKKVLKMARELLNSGDIYIGKNFFKNLDEFYNEDNTITIQDFKSLISDYQSSNVLSVLKLGIPAKRIIEYIDNCYMHQCIPHSQAMGIWSDYLNMAKYINYNLSDKSVKFPSSLKKEHDRAIFVYNTLKKEIDAKMFEDRAKELKKYRWQRKEDEYFITSPETPEDIVQEGQMQKHCVASYVNSIKDRRACVVFLRKKEDPTHSFYTIEIDEEKRAIVQVKGFANRLPSDDVKKYILKYCEAKKLTFKHC